MRDQDKLVARNVTIPSWRREIREPRRGMQVVTQEVVWLSLSLNPPWKLAWTGKLNQDHQRRMKVCVSLIESEQSSLQ